MIKLVAFDWNGTLLADTKYAAEADAACMKLFKLPGPTTLSSFRKKFHIPIKNYWLAQGMSGKQFDANAKLITQKFFEYYEPKEKISRTRAGSKQVLAWLKQNSIRSIIYSNHRSSHIVNQIHRLKIKAFFSHIIGREDYDESHMHTRGKGQKLSAYIKKLKFRPQQVMSIGDTEEEIEIGKKYGYHTVAITGGYNTTARLKKHKPDFLIHTMLELKKIIQKLNNI